jgi:hypothetical protein
MFGCCLENPSTDTVVDEVVAHPVVTVESGLVAGLNRRPVAVAAAALLRDFLICLTNSLPSGGGDDRSSSISGDDENKTSEGSGGNIFSTLKVALWSVTSLLPPVFFTEGILRASRSILYASDSIPTSKLQRRQLQGAVELLLHAPGLQVDALREITDFSFECVNTALCSPKAKVISTLPIHFPNFLPDIIGVPNIEKSALVLLVLFWSIKSIPLIPIQGPDSW